MSGEIQEKGRPKKDDSDLKSTDTRDGANNIERGGKI